LFRDFADAERRFGIRSRTVSATPDAAVAYRDLYARFNEYARRSDRTSMTCSTRSPKGG